MHARRPVLRPLFPFTTLLITFLLAPAAAVAQDVAQHSVGVSSGVVSFDLNGVHTAWGTAVRGSVALSRHLGLEGGAFMSRYDLVPETTTLFVPEAQLQYHWRAGRIVPYAGGGGGFVRAGRYGTSETTWSLSAGGGLRAPITRRLNVLADFRMRGVSNNRLFAGSTSEVMAGVSWRLGG